MYSALNTPMTGALAGSLRRDSERRVHSLSRRQTRKEVFVMPKVSTHVYTNAKDGKDDEFNRWYDHVDLTEATAA